MAEENNPILSPMINFIKLHNNLVKDGFDIPDQKTFFNDMKDDTKRQKLHDNLLKEGYELPDFNTFSSDLGYPQKKKTSSNISKPSESTSQSFDNIPDLGKAPNISAQKDQIQPIQNTAPTLDEIKHSIGGRIAMTKTQGQKVKIGKNEYDMPSAQPVKLSEYLQYKGISPTDILSHDTQDRDLSSTDVTLFDQQLQNIKYKYTSPNVKSEDLQIQDTDSPYVKQAKLIGLQAKTNREATTADKYVGGTVKGIVQGVDEMVVKPLVGLTKLVEDMQGLSTPLGIMKNAVGLPQDHPLTEDVPNFIKKHFKGSILNDQGQLDASVPNLPQNEMGAILGGFASLPGMFLSFAATPEAKIAGVGLKMATNMGLISFGNTYNTLSDENIPITQRLEKAFKEGLKGAKQGLLMEGIMYAGAGNPLKSIAVNAAGFGGLNVVDQFNQTGDVDWHSAIGNAIFGGTLGVMGGGEYKPDGIQILPKRINDALANYFGTPSDALKTSAYMDLDVNKVREIADKLVGKVIPNNKVEVTENGDGTQSVKIDVDPNSLTKQDVNDLTQGQTLHNLADAAALDKHFSDPKVAEKAISDIQNSDIQDDQKQLQIAKIKESVANNDPINQKSEPIAAEVEQLEQQKQAIQGEPISDVVKEAKTKAVDEQIKEKKAQIAEIINPTKPPEDANVPTKTEKVGGKKTVAPKEVQPELITETEPIKALDQATKQGKKIYSDFDDTLFDPKTEKLTPLGEDIKARIAKGEDISITTHRKDTPESRKQIADMLGIDPAKIHMDLSPEGKAEISKDGVLIDDNSANIEAKKKAGGEVIEVPKKETTPTEKKVEPKTKEQLAKDKNEKARIKKTVAESKALKSDKERVAGVLSSIKETLQEGLKPNEGMSVEENYAEIVNKVGDVGPLIEDETYSKLREKGIDVDDKGTVTIKTPKGEFKFKLENFDNIEKAIKEKYPVAVSKGGIPNPRQTAPRSKSGIYDSNELISIHEQNLAEAKRTGNKELADVFQKEIEYLKKNKPYESTTETPRDTPTIIDQAQTVESKGKLAENPEQATESIAEVDKLLGEIDNKVNEQLKPQEDAVKTGKVEEGNQQQHKGSDAQLPQEGDNRDVNTNVKQEGAEASNSDSVLKSEKEVNDKIGQIAKLLKSRDNKINQKDLEKQILKKYNDYVKTLGEEKARQGLESELKRASGDNSGILMSSISFGLEKYLYAFGKMDVEPRVIKSVNFVKNLAKESNRILRPVSQGLQSRAAARIMRYKLAELAHKTQLAYESFKIIGDHFDKLSDDYKIKLIDYAENKTEYQKQGIPRFGLQGEIEAMDLMQDLLGEKYDYISKTYLKKKADHIKFIEDYFPHFWEKPDKVESFMSKLMGGKNLKGEEGFLKERKLPDTKYGIQQGFTPLTTNPVELYLLKNREMDRFIMGSDIFNSFKRNKLVKYVPLLGGKHPEGYTKINGKLGQVMQFSEKEKGLIHRGNYYMPDDAALIVNNYLSMGLSGTPLKGIYEIMRESGNMLNQAQLGLSAFHAGFTTMDVMVSKAALGLMKLSQGNIGGLKDLVTFPISPITNFMEGYAFRDAYKGKGIISPELQKLIQDAEIAGVRVDMDAIYTNNAIDNFYKALRGSGNQPSNPIGAAIRAPGAILEKASRPIMAHLVPIQKLGVFIDMAKNVNSEAKRKNWTEEKRQDRLQEAWDSVDNRMGQLVYDNLFWNKTLKDLSMVMVRSVGWNFGSIRELGGGIKDTGTTAKNVYSNIKNKIKGVPERTEVRMTPRMAYTFTMPFVVGLAGAITSYLYTGKSPDNLQGYYYIKTGYKNEDGTDERVSLPSYMKDVYAYSNEPFKTVKNKFHPMLGAITNMLLNKDFFGYNITDEDIWTPSLKHLTDELEYAATQFIPFGISNMMQRKKSGEPLSRQLQSFIGITPAPKYISNTKAQTEIGELYSSRFGGATKPKAQKDIDEWKKQIVSLLKKKNIAETDEEKDTLQSQAEDALQEGIEKGYTKEASKTREFQALTKRVTGAFDEFAFKRFSNYDKTKLLLKFNDEAFKKYFPLAKNILDKVSDEDAEELRAKMKKAGIQPEPETVGNFFN